MDSVLAVGFILAALIAGFIVADQYSKKCKQTTRRLSEGGAMEGNATFFGILLLGLALLDIEKMYLAFLLGIWLLYVVVKSFVSNWESS